VLIVASACAPRRVIVAPATPAYPDFVFPAVPAPLADADLSGRQQQAWHLLQSGSLNQSADELSAVLRRSPGFYPSDTALGYVDLARRNETAALARFDQVLARAAGYAPALAGRGLALLALKRDDEALAAFEAALAADPGLADVARRIEVLRFRAVQDRLADARAATAAGQLEEARAAYERAIGASPESALLYRELAGVEQRLGGLDRAVALARRAVDVDQRDARSWALLGELLEASGDLTGAADALARASALEPSPALSAQLAAVRSRAELARLPPEYGAIGATPHVTRGELAALIGVKLAHLLRGASRQEGVVFTDGRDHWASAWIQDVVRAGVIEIYPNHTFQPAATVSRGDLALSVRRLLDLASRLNPSLARRWQGSPPVVVDVAPEHLSYPAVSAAVQSGVMPLLAGNTFQMGRPVAGADAIRAVDRLSALAPPGGASPNLR
jgi:tetratricopeptide (TPR) repeat protein